MTLGAEMFTLLVQQVGNGGDAVVLDWAWVFQQGVPFTLEAVAIWAILTGKVVLKRENETRDVHIARLDAQIERMDAKHESDKKALAVEHEKELTQVRLDFERRLTEAESRKSEMAAAYEARLSRMDAALTRWEATAWELAGMAKVAISATEAGRGP